MPTEEDGGEVAIPIFVIPAKAGTQSMRRLTYTGFPLSRE